MDELLLFVANGGEAALALAAHSTKHTTYFLQLYHLSSFLPKATAEIKERALGVVSSGVRLIRDRPCAEASAGSKFGVGIFLL